MNRLIEYSSAGIAFSLARLASYDVLFCGIIWLITLLAMRLILGYYENFRKGEVIESFIFLLSFWLLFGATRVNIFANIEPIAWFLAPEGVILKIISSLALAKLISETVFKLYKKISGKVCPVTGIVAATNDSIVQK